MSTPLIPTAEQLAATRAALWHQNGQPLLTLESLRDWIGRAGLVLYTRRPQQLPGPMPTLVEAVLGAINAEPTLAETESARTLLARLIAEGSAVPLNLLGGTTDVPDFVCSPAAFCYIFTLRGDKTWKQPPATIGPVKVSPLGLATYEAIARRVTLTAAELATELGKEVTEAAVLRALSELWAHLRVLPVPRPDAPVTWELMSTRLTKQIKAGANAGQPTALSALISLYLGMVTVASEEEIEIMLSPLAPRSRIRDVVHALMGAREIETLAIDGRTVLYLDGSLPTFGSTGVSAEGPVQPADGETPAALHTVAAEGRISKFVPKPKKLGTGFAKRFIPRAPDAERERRPFQKKPFGAPTRPSFSKPWDEDRAVARGTANPAAADGPGERPPFAKSPGFSPRPGFGQRGPAAPGGMRPTFRHDDGRGPTPSQDRPRRDFTPRDPADGAAPRKPFGGKPGFGSKPGFGAKPGFKSRPDRPAGPLGSSQGRPPFAGSGDARPPRRDFTPRTEGGGERRPGSYSARPQGSGYAGKNFVPRPESPRPDAPRGAEGAGDAPRKPFHKFDAPRPGPDRPRYDRPRFDKPAPGQGSFRPSSSNRSRPDRPSSDRPGFDQDRPKRPFNPDAPARPAFAGKPGGFAGKKPFAPKPFGAKSFGAKSFGPKPPGTFAKFAGGAKPFRPAKSGYKPGGKPFAKPGDGPTFRKRKPEEGESA